MSRNVTSRRVDFLIWAFLIGLIGYLLTKLDFGPLVRVKATQSVAHASTKMLAEAVKSHRREYGSYPAGDNAQIIATLRGENPGKVVFFETPSTWINPKGELIDPWGTPYRFDLSDPTKPRFWSCGKNRRDDGGAEGSDDIPSWR